MPPVLQQASGFRCHLPLIGVGELSPLVNVAPNLVDDRVGVVLLFGCGNSLWLLENQFGLFFAVAAPALLGLWNWCDERGTATRLNNFVRGLPVFVELPMPARVGVGRVKNRLLEKVTWHSARLLLVEARAVF